MSTFFSKLKSFFSKAWAILIIPLSLFLAKIFFGSSKDSKAKEEIKETSKEIKQESKEIEQRVQEIEKTEDKLDQQVQEIEEILDKPPVKDDDKIHTILPGLKK